MKLRFERDKLIDLLVVLACIPIIEIVSIAANMPGAISLFFYYGLPAAYLSARKPKNYSKILLASITMGLLLGMVYDLSVEFHTAWIVHYGLFPWNRVAIGHTPLGDFVWAFLIPFYTTIFYEHFLDTEKKKKLARGAMPFFLFALAFFILAEILLIFSPHFPHIDYAYALFGVVTMLPLLGVVVFRPRTLWKVLLISAFFFLFNLAGEATWVSLGYAEYSGEYLGWIPLGAIRFPFEELFFWTIFSSPSFILCYELFFDDGK